MLPEEKQTSTSSKTREFNSTKIDVNEFLTSLTNNLNELSQSISGESSIDMMSVLDEMLAEIESMDTSKPPDLDPDSEEPTGPEPDWDDLEPIDKEQLKAEVESMRVQLQGVKAEVDVAKTNLENVLAVQDTTIPELIDCLNKVNEWVEIIARTQSGGSGRFNTEDLAHVTLAQQYIKTQVDYLVSVVKKIESHFGELTTLEMICVTLIPIASCDQLIANIIKAAWAITGDAFALTIIKAFINTRLHLLSPLFMDTAAKILEITRQISNMCMFVIGLIDADIGEFYSVISKIFAYVDWLLDCTTHATGVMAVEPVPIIPKPVCGWNVVDPYYWIPGDEEPFIDVMNEEISIVNEEAPVPIVQGINVINKVNDFVIDEKYIPPVTGFDPGGHIF